jgi:formylglycine-generating enzyme required for sulfatase activity
MNHKRVYAIVLAAIALVALIVISLSAAHAHAIYIEIPAGQIQSVLANDADPSPTKVAGFQIQATPVTNAEFLLFVIRHPQWQRGRTPTTFSDTSYLHQWQSAKSFDIATVNHPVTNVSWFAAEAYCESEDARLPTWSEWEYVAAANETQFDARSDAAWRARILTWYSRPATSSLQPVGGIANAYGVRDLHGLVWEWVDDFNALLISADSRTQGDPDKLLYCGAGGISLKDRNNYAVLMRIALLSSLNAADATSSLGFRCARSSSVAPVNSKIKEQK